MDLIKRILIACFILCLISCKESKVNNIKLEYPYLINSDIKANTESVFFTDTNYVIRSINVNNYKLNWEFNLEKRIDFLKIKFVDKYLFIGGNTENQYSYWLIERNDGSLILRHTFNYNIYHDPLFIENDLYFINSEFQIIKCNIFDDLCNVVSIEGTAFGVPNNLVKYNDKLYTSHDGNLVEINFETLEISNITPPSTLNFRELLIVIFF